MKMVISLVIEAQANDIHEIKGKILETASEAIVSCAVDIIPSHENKQIEIPKFVMARQKGGYMKVYVYDKDEKILYDTYTQVYGIEETKTSFILRGIRQRERFIQTINKLERKIKVFVNGY